MRLILSCTKPQLFYPGYIVAFWTIRPACADPEVTLNVLVRITDQEGRPMPAQDVRVVIGTPTGWQKAGEGSPLHTDTQGQARFTTSAKLERRTRKRPTNFVSSLLSLPEAVDRLQIAVELEFAGFHWLYVYPVDRFVGDGDIVYSDCELYSRNGDGAFLLPARYRDGAWFIEDLKGMAL